jgi:hypothetical protein
LLGAFHLTHPGRVCGEQDHRLRGATEGDAASLGRFAALAFAGVVKKHYGASRLSLQSIGEIDDPTHVAGGVLIGADHRQGERIDNNQRISVVGHCALESPAAFVSPQIQRLGDDVQWNLSVDPMLAPPGFNPGLEAPRAFGRDV